MLQKLRRNRRIEVHARAGGHIIDEDGDLHSIGDGEEVLDQPAPIGLVVIGRDDQKPIRAQVLRFHGIGNGRARVVRARAHDQRDAPGNHIHGAFHQFRALRAREGRGFAGRPQGDNRVGFRFNLPIDQLFIGRQIHLAFGKGRDQRHAAAVKQRAVHFNPLHKRSHLPDRRAQSVAAEKEKKLPVQSMERGAWKCKEGITEQCRCRDSA